MRRLIKRIETALVRIHDFIGNTSYYLGRGYGLMQAISLARITLPPR